MVGGEALRLAPPGAGVLVETLCELATRGKSTSTSGTGSGKGAGARVAVRSVLEDHETAILELERQVCVVEGLVNDVDLFGKLVSDLQDIAFKNRDSVSHDCRTWHDSGDEGGAAGVCGGHVGDQGAGNAAGGGGP